MYLLLILCSRQTPDIDQFLLSKNCVLFPFISPRLAYNNCWKIWRQDEWVSEWVNEWMRWWWGDIVGVHLTDHWEVIVRCIRTGDKPLAFVFFLSSRTLKNRNYFNCCLLQLLLLFATWTFLSTSGYLLKFIWRLGNQLCHLGLEHLQLRAQKPHQWYQDLFWDRNLEWVNKHQHICSS